MGIAQTTDAWINWIDQLLEANKESSYSLTSELSHMPVSVRKNICTIMMGLPTVDALNASTILDHIDHREASNAYGVHSSPWVHIQAEPLSRSLSIAPLAGESISLHVDVWWDSESADYVVTASSLLSTQTILTVIRQLLWDAKNHIRMDDQESQALTSLQQFVASWSDYDITTFPMSYKKWLMHQVETTWRTNTGLKLAFECLAQNKNLDTYNDCYNVLQQYCAVYAMMKNESNSCKMYSPQEICI